MLWESMMKTMAWSNQWHLFLFRLENVPKSLGGGDEGKEVQKKSDSLFFLLLRHSFFPLLQQEKCHHLISRRTQPTTVLSVAKISGILAPCPAFTPSVLIVLRTTSLPIRRLLLLLGLLFLLRLLVSYVVLLLRFPGMEEWLLYPLIHLLRIC